MIKRSQYWGIWTNKTKRRRK